MDSELVANGDIQKFLNRISGLDGATGDGRLKQIVRRIISDLFKTIDEFNVEEEEFWKAVNFLASAAPELGLWAAGLGFEHFLDIRADIADQKAGVKGGTPRTIEGPLYVAGAPREAGFARLDDGTDKGETLIMHGRVFDDSSRPVAGAVVDIWHANTLGKYSYFDPSQSKFNLRRQVVTGADGRYKFRSILPAGYAVPPNGTTERLLKGIGRHGNRPAHIHFFVSAPGHRHLTTQINISGDPYLYEDFAYATREELIPPMRRREEAEAIHAEGLNAPFIEIEFDFELLSAQDFKAVERSDRQRQALAN